MNLLGSKKSSDHPLRTFLSSTGSLLSLVNYKEFLNLSPCPVQEFTPGQCQDILDNSKMENHQRKGKKPNNTKKIENKTHENPCSLIHWLQHLRQNKIFPLSSCKQKKGDTFNSNYFKDLVCSAASQRPKKWVWREWQRTVLFLMAKNLILYT